MSRQNKVNPGIYTQRGRLTQDDAARELRKQNLSGSRHTQQPLNTRRRVRPAPAGDATPDTETSADRKTPKEPSNADANDAKAKTDTPRTSKRTTGKAKTDKPVTTAMKRTAKTPTRKAASAGNVRRGAAEPPAPMKRRKS